MKTDVRRFKDSEGVVHLYGDTLSGDYLLCGDAPEGLGESLDQEGQHITRGKVTCNRCIAIVEFCKRVPARLIRRKSI